MTMFVLETDTDLTALLPKLEARARRLTGDPDAAQDLAQEAALKLWSARREGREIEDFEAYAMTTLRHLVTSRWRSRVVAEPLEEDCATTPPDALVRISLARTQAAIDRLPDAQARLMRYVVEGDTSPADLARRTGLPPGTVMSRLARARAQLRREMDLPDHAPVSGLY